jgi:hypothetical protein
MSLIKTGGLDSGLSTGRSNNSGINLCLNDRWKGMGDFASFKRGLGSGLGSGSEGRLEISEDNNETK